MLEVMSCGRKEPHHELWDCLSAVFYAAVIVCAQHMIHAAHIVLPIHDPCAVQRQEGEESQARPLGGLHGVVHGRQTKRCPRCHVPRHAVDGEISRDQLHDTFIRPSFVSLKLDGKAAPVRSSALDALVAGRFD